MALSATVAIDVRKGASDNNGGFWNTASSGTDYSQNTAEHVFVDGATITAVVQATTTDLLVVGYTVAAGDVGNGYQVTGGTATAGFYEIISVNTGTNTWTMDRAVGTATQTTIGRMGGSLLTLGKAGSVPRVAGNIIYVMYNATAFVTTSTTADVSNGRLACAVGTTAAPCWVIGYEAVHGDTPTTRPTLQWGVNAANAGIFTTSSAAVLNLRNLIIDANQANFTGTRGINNASTGSVFYFNCKILNPSVSAMLISAASNVHLINCEVTACVTTTAINITSTPNLYLFGCNIHDNTVDGISSNQAGGSVTAFRCIFDTNKSTTTKSHIVFTSTCRAYLMECVLYNSGSFGVDLQADIFSQFVDCLFESNGGYGVNCAAAGVYDGVFMMGCGFYNNTSGKYDTAKILTTQVFNEVVNTTGTFFTDAANADFTLNNTALQGALARGTGWPATLPGATGTNYSDIGSYQHQDSGTGGGGGPLIVDGVSSLILT